MTNKQGVLVTSARRLCALAALAVLLGLVMLPGSAWAVSCPPPDRNVDTDGDGFTDGQECDGITTITPPGAPTNTIPACVPDATTGVITNRRDCVDLNSRDVFAIYKPMSSDSLLTGNPDLPAEFPFGALQFSCIRSDGSSWCGTGVTSLSFDGYSALGVTVHQLTPDQAASDRTVSSVSTQKAVRISESLNTSAKDPLGYCSWGTPLGLDGCTIYTKRAKNFIDEKCNLAKDTTATNRNHVFVAYAALLAVHEGAHALGGLTTQNVPSLGGYHYASTSHVIMAQAVEYSTQGRRCTFYIPAGWNMTLDPPAIRLIIP